MLIRFPMQFYTFPGKFGQGFAPDSILINSGKNLTLVFEQDFFLIFQFCFFPFTYSLFVCLVLANTLSFCLVLANTLVAAMLVLAYLFCICKENYFYYAD